PRGGRGERISPVTTKPPIGSIRGHARYQPTNAVGLFFYSQGGRDQCSGALAGGERHRQGNGGGGNSSSQRPKGRFFCRDQLQCHSRESVGERTLRSRKRGIYRCAHSAQRTVGNSQRRYSLSG